MSYYRDGVWGTPGYGPEKESLDAALQDAVKADQSAIRESVSALHKFATGAVRSKDADAMRYDLISPIGLAAVAATCAEGAAKYDDFNWEKGMPVHDLLNHALRHIFKHLEGDRSEPHLPHAAWGLLAAIHSDALWPHMNEGHQRGPGCTPPVKTDAK